MKFSTFNKNVEGTLTKGLNRNFNMIQKSLMPLPYDTTVMVSVDDSGQLMDSISKIPKNLNGNRIIIMLATGYHVIQGELLFEGFYNGSITVMGQDGSGGSGINQKSIILYSDVESTIRIAHSSATILFLNIHHQITDVTTARPIIIEGGSKLITINNYWNFTTANKDSVAITVHGGKVISNYDYVKGPLDDQIKITFCDLSGNEAYVMDYGSELNIHNASKETIPMYYAAAGSGTVKIRNSSDAFITTSEDDTILFHDVEPFDTYLPLTQLEAPIISKGDVSTVDAVINIDDTNDVVNEEGIALYWKEKDSPIWLDNVILPADATTYLITGLDENVRYNVYCRALGNNLTILTSKSSNVLEVKTDKI